MNKQLHHDSILALAQVERVQVLGPRWREAIEQPEAMDGPRAFAGQRTSSTTSKYTRSTIRLCRSTTRSTFQSLGTSLYSRIVDTGQLRTIHCACLHVIQCELISSRRCANASLHPHACRFPLERRHRRCRRPSAKDCRRLLPVLVDLEESEPPSLTEPRSSVGCRRVSASQWRSCPQEKSAVIRFHGHKLKGPFHPCDALGHTASLAPQP